MSGRTLGLLIALVGLAAGAEQPPVRPALACADGVPGAPACTASREHLREARSAFAHGLKFEHSKHFAEAYAEFERAAQLVPREVQYATARELLREELVFQHLQSGNQDVLAGRQIEAMAEFRSALALDSENETARQQLQALVSSQAPATASAQVVAATTTQAQVSPGNKRADFHYRGDSRGLLSQIASTFGISVTLDDSVVSRHVRFDVEKADFFTAMGAASTVTKTFWTPLDESQILIAADNPENHRSFDRLAMRTFYIPNASTPQDLTEYVNVLRSVFDIRLVIQQPQSNTIMVRAPQKVLEAATHFIFALDAGRPQVMLDVHVYEISHTLTRDMGVHIPNQFKLFNIPAAALLALGGQNIQNLINQLISSGGINQANSTALSALLAQLQGQNGQNSIFSQPVATFGGGLTLMGLTLDQLTATLSLNESAIKSLEHATLRASHDKDATFHVGTRYPILNATFAPIFNSSAISQVIQNNSFTPAFPSFNYEDLGVSVKAKPTIHGNYDVGLQLELQIRALTGQKVNGVPVISNREFKGSIMLKNGEPAVIAGSVSHNELQNLSGIPGLGQVPGINKVMATNSLERDDDELLVVITPNVVSGLDRGPDSEIWMSKQ